MLLCKYAEKINCKSCNVVYHKQCKNFLSEHYKYLCSSIIPFKYVTVKSQTAYSRDINIAKSNAFLLAVKSNAPVKKYSLSQVLSIVISNLEIEAPVIYIEYDKKAQGDPDKVKSCLMSFIEQQQLKGSSISVYIAPSIVCQLDIPKL